MYWKAVADYDEMSRFVAAHIYAAITEAAKRGQRFNLGLATGNTMIEVYRLLAEKLNRNRILLDLLHTYNLDEYVGSDGDAVAYTHPLSYSRYMHENLFNRLDRSLGLRDEQIHFPDPIHSARYDAEIAEAGGLNLQLLGIGFNGHIAFNEPEAGYTVGVAEYGNRPSRVISLTPLTLKTNAQLTAGGNLDDVPTLAVTMGMKTILEAQEILLSACFSEQEEPLKQLQKGKITPELPASYLLSHANAGIIYTADKINLD